MTIPILEDDVVEDSETINITLTSADPAAILNPTAATVTIQDSNGKYIWQSRVEIKHYSVVYFDRITTFEAL